MSAIIIKIGSRLSNL